MCIGKGGCTCLGCIACGTLLNEESNANPTTKVSKKRYTAIVEWLYRNDGVYPDKYAWREAFLEFLREILDRQ